MRSVPPQSVAANSLLTPALIDGRFEIEGVLGRGGMGIVYKVRDRRDGRVLALKRVGLRAQPRAQALLEREYRTLARLLHRSIIEVYDYALETSDDGECAYYTMELLDGQDLGRLAPLPYPQVCRYARQVATTLALLHARGLLHRDVTPRNVRITGADQCKLIDFGALCEIGEVGALLGTAPCMPPEVLEREPLDQRVDLYALGCVIYYALTGQHAFPAAQVQQLPSYWAKPPAPPSRVVQALIEQGRALPPVPQELDALVMQLLRLDRSARTSSAGAVIDRLDVIEPQPGAEPFDLAQSYLHSAPTVGRDPLLRAAQQWGLQVRQGVGHVALIEGGPGVGKTRLLSEMALSVRLAGGRALVIGARAHDGPYATAAALCRCLLSLAPRAALEAAKPYARLAPLAPGLCDVPGATPADIARDDAAWQAAVHEDLRQFVIAMGRSVPLAIFIDDFDACDHASAALIANLARDAKPQGLVLVATMGARDGEQDPVRRTLCALGSTHALSNLASADVERWCAAVFGSETPNLSRLCQFVYARTGGNPRACDELVRGLLQSEQVSYRGGTWLLPLEPSELGLPRSVLDAVRTRLSGLSASASSVARACSVYRGTLDAPLCTALCELEPAEISAALAELVAKRVFAWVADGYVFAHRDLRELSYEQLAAAERAQLHKRIGKWMLARKASGLGDQLAAGLHLLEAGDAEGAALLSHGALALCTQPESIAGCVPMLERGLELCQVQGRGPYVTGPLLAALCAGAYVVDRRLDRHAPELTRCFHRLIGLDVAGRLRLFLGRRLGFFVGFAWGWLRWVRRPRAQRHASFVELVRAFVAASLALAGKCAICLDGPGARAHAEQIEPLSLLGRHSLGRFAYDYCRMLARITQDRLTATYAYGLELEQRLHGKAMQSQLTDALRRTWQGGLHYVLGVLEGFASDPKVLARVEQLQHSELSVDRLVAAQLRRVYYTFRGDGERVREADATIEAYALQIGSSWQVETWSAIITNYGASLWGDPVEAKRSLEQTERLAAVIPSLARYADAARALYQLRLGQAREAIQGFRRLLEAEQPGERTGWCASMGLLAQAYNLDGDPERAKEVCEQALRLADPRDAHYAGMWLPLASAHIAALAALSEHEEAAQRVQALLLQHEHNGSPVVQGSVHEIAARAAFERGDRKAFTRHLKQVEAQFCPLGEPGLIGRFLQLTALGGSEGGISRKIALMREVTAFETALSAIAERALLARHMLSWLMQKCEGFAGYLYVASPDGPPLLLAATDPQPPPAAVEQLAQRSLVERGVEEVTTHCGSAELNTHAERPASKHSQRAAAEVLHVHMLSYVEGEQYFGEGALLLRGTQTKPPRLRYDLLRVAARHLRRLRPSPASRPSRPELKLVDAGLRA